MLFHAFRNAFPHSFPQVLKTCGKPTRSDRKTVENFREILCFRRFFLFEKNVPPSVDFESFADLRAENFPFSTDLAHLAHFIFVFCSRAERFPVFRVSAVFFSTFFSTVLPPVFHRFLPNENGVASRKIAVFHSFRSPCYYDG